MPNFNDTMRFVRFVVVGLASTAVYFAVLIILDSRIEQVWLLTNISYALSMVFNYLAQARYTFRAGALSHIKVRRYVTMHAAAMAVNAVAMAALVARGAPLILAQIFVTGFIAFVVFFISRYWVFPSK